MFSRRAGLPAAEGVHWESAAEGDFTVESVELEQRGTKIVLHLKTPDTCLRLLIHDA